MGTEPPIDLEFALGRVDGDEGLLREIAGLFGEESDKLISDMEAALAAGDSDSLEKAAHTMKGMIANFGASAAVAAAARLQEIGASADMAAAPDTLARLKEEVERVKPFLNNLGMEKAA